MTEAQIQNAIKSAIGSREVMVPNCGTVYYWEADLLAVVPRSLYVEEYEIKTSRADFLRDFPRQGAKWVRKNALEIAHRTRAPQQRNRSYKAPNRFYYVVKAGEVDVSEIPDYAGFYEVDSVATLEGEVLTCRRVRRAPVLHRDQVSAKDLCSMTRGVSLRFWDLRQKLESANARAELLQTRLEEVAA